MKQRRDTPRRQGLAARLEKLTARGDPDECWPFLGSMKHNGYGQLAGEDMRPDGVHRKNGYAHRAAYELAHGPIPEGMTVDHLCHTTDCRDGCACTHRRCVNPAHLGLATAVDNYRRTGINQERCKAGHKILGPGVPCKKCRLKRDPKEGPARRGKFGPRPGSVPEWVKQKVRAAVAAGSSQADQAREYNLSTQQVSRIVKGRPETGKAGRKAVGISPESRFAVKERDGFTCVRCGDSYGHALSVHHRTPRGMGGSRDDASQSPANLILLCGSGTTGCHGWVESNRETATEQGWIVHHGIDARTVPVRYPDGYLWVLRDDGTKTPCP